MRIVYIIGNGFDLSLGLKTKYSDFYNYLNQNYESCSPSLRGLLKDVGADCELWSNMESALGLYTEKLKTDQELKDLYEELNTRFNKYLLREEELIKHIKEAGLRKQEKELPKNLSVHVFGSAEFRYLIH